MIKLTCTISSGRKLQLCDVIRRSRLDPDTLPDTTAGSVEDVRGIESLLANRNDVVVTVSRIVDEDEAVNILVIPCLWRNGSKQGHSQLVGTVRGEVISHVNCELEVAASIEAGILAIDVYPCFVVDGTEVQVCALPSPVCWNVE